MIYTYLLEWDREMKERKRLSVPELVGNLVYDAGGAFSPVTRPAQGFAADCSLYLLKSHANENVDRFQRDRSGS